MNCHNSISNIEHRPLYKLSLENCIIFIIFIPIPLIDFNREFQIYSTCRRDYVRFSQKNNEVGKHQIFISNYFTTSYFVSGNREENDFGQEEMITKSEIQSDANVFITYIADIDELEGP